MRKSLRSWAKRVPGAVWLVRRLRQGREWIAFGISRFIERRLDSEYWRSHRFDAHSGQYMLGCHPNESYVVAASDTVIGKRLYSRGAFDLQKLERAFEILRVEQPGAMPDVLVDVGANVGSICIPAVKRGLVKRALAFEPDPGNFRLLRINVLLNGAEGEIECHELALGETAGTAMLAFNPANHGDHRIVLGVLPGIGSHEVSVRTLDSFHEQSQGHVWLLWLDVQGFEPEVLAGASRAMAAGWPIVMEFTPDDLDARGTLGKLIEMIARSPYTRFYDLDRPGADAVGLPVARLQQVADALRQRESFTDLLFLTDDDMRSVHVSPSV
jgi:FkbM family methyltransferase